MKKNLFLFFALLFIFTPFLYSQSGWFWQNPRPQGNAIFGIKMFDADNGIFINSDNILSTHDGGQSWQLAYTGFPWENKSISMVDDNNYYMLVDTAAIIKTSNKGVTWQYVSNTPEIKNSFIYFKDINSGFAVKHTTAANTFIYRTSDAGVHWSLSLSNETAYLSSVKFINAQTGFAAGKRQPPANTIIYRTTDAGLSWDTIANNCKLQRADMYFTGGTTGYLFGQESGMSGRTYRTIDGGLSWNLYTPMNTVLLYEMQFIDGQLGFALAGNRMYRTTNGGINWINSPILVNNAAYNTYKLYFVNSMTGYTAGTEGVILKTTDAGLTWNKIAGNKLIEGRLWSISFADNNTGFIIGYDNRLFRTTNGGTHWQVLQFSPELAFSAMSFVNPDIWYVSSENGKILKTTNAGNSWDTSYANVYNPTRIEFINEQTGYGVCKYNNFIKTTNGGVNWLVTSPFGAQNWAMDFIDANTGFAGNDGGNLYKTTDAGITWFRTDPNPHDFYINDIQFVNHNTGFIAAGYSENGVLKTTNGGINWMPSIQGVYYVSDIHFLNERTGYAIGRDGLGDTKIYKTTNGGNNWSGLRTCTIEELNALHFSDSTTGWAIGYNGIIIKTTNGGESVTFDPPVEIPTSFYLFQNYPNPFNPVTTIRYGLPKDLNVKIKIYDILGRLVTELVNQHQPAGNYSVNFDGSVIFKWSIFLYS